MGKFFPSVDVFDPRDPSGTKPASIILRPFPPSLTVTEISCVIGVEYCFYSFHKYHEIRKFSYLKLVHISRSLSVEFE